MLHGGHDLRRRDASGQNGHPLLHAPGNNLFIVTGRYNEPRTGLHRLPALGQGNDRSRAHQHLGTALGHGADGPGGGIGAEGDLHHVHTAVQQSPGSWQGVASVIDDHHGHDSRVGKSLKGIHNRLPPSS